MMIIDDRKWIFIIFLLTSLGLPACNEQNAPLVIEPDWIHNPSEAAPTPSPTPTAEPSPNTSPTPTPTPSPTPSPTPTQDTTELYTGPAELAKYVQKFIDDGKAQGTDVLPDMNNPKLEVRVTSLDYYGASVIGLCESGGGQRRVTFDPDFWDSVSETQREILAHHEFGHCILYRPHRTDRLTSGAYASIMYPIIMASSTYLNNYNYYQAELFGQAAMAAQSADVPVTHICNVEDL